MSNSRPLQSRKILVIEDQYYLATDICEWLEEAGAVVVGPAGNATKACALLREEEIDTAVVDINLGQGATYEVAKELTDRRVPFLFATGYDVTAIPREFQASKRLEKPFSAATLVAAVAGLKPPER